MTPEQYWQAVLDYKAKYPTSRLYQSAFNVLVEARPDLSEKIRATNLDPFFVKDEDVATDKRVALFRKFLSDNW